MCNCAGYAEVNIEKLPPAECCETLMIMHRFLNYFDYFIRFGEVEFSSSTVGEGGSGRSFGINNGIGIFGSVAIDRHWIPMIP